MIMFYLCVIRVPKGMIRYLATHAARRFAHIKGKKYQINGELILQGNK